MRDLQGTREIASEAPLPSVLHLWRFCLLCGREVIYVTSNRSGLTGIGIDTR
jgi:hypothetical protein